MHNDKTIYAIRSRMQNGLSAGDSERDIWHDKSVDQDMETLIEAVDERQSLLEEILDEADTSEDAGDFILWLQDRLADLR